MKKLIKNIAKSVGVGLTSLQRLQDLETLESEFDEIFAIATETNVAFKDSKSQLKQDLFVLFETKFKKNGFFVEFGATNGIDLSNTYLLERGFGWKGILAEPATCWHHALRKNRPASAIETKCVWSESEKVLEFNMASEAELSTITTFNSRDQHAEKRKNGVTYNVETISLTDLLRHHNAPMDIDYLSIDTEGSEFEILRNFDFSTYRIGIITCEHNFTSDRQKIFELLTSKGYQRKYSRASKWDDWYVMDAGAMIDSGV